MNRVPRRWRIALVLLTMTAAAILASHLLRPLRDAQAFYIPSAAEAREAQALFAAALGDKAGLAGSARALGLDLRTVEGGAPGLALREAAGDCRGRGVYRLREGAALPLALVAPHRGSDRHTGELAGKLFEEMPVAAAAWNSAPRRATPECPGGGDATRVETHYLTAFSLAFAEAHPNGRIVQLHGFEGAKRQSSVAQLADIIVSDGSTKPGRRLLDLADCLSVGLYPLRIMVFPLDTHELGAQQNRQGRALRAEGFEGFVHLELSAPLRQRLVEDDALRARLGACLAEGLA